MVNISKSMKQDPTKKKSSTEKISISILIHLPIILGLREWPNGTERKILRGNAVNEGFGLSEGGIYQPRTKPREKKKPSQLKLVCEKESSTCGFTFITSTRGGAFQVEYGLTTIE